MTNKDAIKVLAVEARDRGLLDHAPTNEAEEDAMYVVQQLLEGADVPQHELDQAEGYLDRLLGAGR
jgi:hypothetical protein